MKHIYSFLLIAGILVYTQGTVYAETPSQQKSLVETRKEVRGDIKDMRNEVKEDIKGERENLKNDIETRRLDLAKQIAKKRYDVMLARYKATIQRIENIQTKIITRIEKIKVAGGKTDTAEKFVVEAKTHLADARTSYAKLEIAIQTAIANTATTTASTTPKSVKDATKNLRTVTQEVEKHIQASRVSLEKALGSLRGVSSIIHATSTTSTTTTGTTTN